MKVDIPKSLKLEHDKLHTELANAIKVEGKIGDSAKNIAKILHPHFLKEEEFAMPPLGLLPSLANGKINDMTDVIEMTNKLKAELPQMLDEHKAIIVSLMKLIDAAKEEKKMEYVHFAERLILHAQNEEEVLYPASILVGEYIKLKTK